MGAGVKQEKKFSGGLLGETDPVPVEIFNASGKSPFVLTCEHAGRLVPKSLGDMGLVARHLERHIAWDIGAEGLAQLLARALDAPLVIQRYSRLVIDCNRPVHAQDAIPAVSDGTDIPGNRGLADTHKQARVAAIHQPYHGAIKDLLDTRERARRPTALVSLHSFTPCLEARPAPRPWEVGLLFNRHRQLSHRVHDALVREAPHLSFTFNEPYQVTDHSDYTIPVHGEGRGIPNMLLEVRNDQIAEEAGQKEWSALLAVVLRNAAARL